MSIANEIRRVMDLKDADVERLQARVDALMLEFCPDEMTPQQLERWGENQKPVKLTGEIERLTLQRDAQAENATQWFDRANGWEIEAKALGADNERLKKSLTHTAARLAAAISLLERGGKAAKKAAPSDKMFDQMLLDYKKALSDARVALAAGEPREPKAITMPKSIEGCFPSIRDLSVEIGFDDGLDDPEDKP